MKKTRITIMLDESLAQKVRQIQASQIRKSKQNASFSGVLNDLLRKSIR